MTLDISRDNVGDAMSDRARVVPLTVHIGAEIHGVDLRHRLDDDTVTAIRAALLQWKVIFFRDQRIGPSEQLQFGRRFGEVTTHPTLPALDGFPEILLLASREQTGDDPTRLDARWHSDVTFVHEPPLGSILHGVDVPEVGGDTQWASTVAAYQGLSEAVRAFLDGLHAVHRNVLQLVRDGEGLPSEYRKAFSSRPLAALHPVVRVHPETGERALFVNPTFTSHIVELSNRESGHLLAMLYEHLGQAEYTVRFRWTPGSVAFWDNRSTVHLAPRDLAPRAAGEFTPRVMHRITLAGDAPIGTDGVRSRSLDGEAFG